MPISSWPWRSRLTGADSCRGEAPRMGRARRDVARTGADALRGGERARSVGGWRDASARRRPAGLGAHRHRCGGSYIRSARGRPWWRSPGGSNVTAPMTPPTSSWPRHSAPSYGHWMGHLRATRAASTSRFGCSPPTDSVLPRRSRRAASGARQPLLRVASGPVTLPRRAGKRPCGQGRLPRMTTRTASWAAFDHDGAGGAGDGFGRARPAEAA